MTTGIRAMRRGFLVGLFLSPCLLAHVAHGDTKGTLGDIRAKPPTPKRAPKAAPKKTAPGRSKVGAARPQPRVTRPVVKKTPASRPAEVARKEPPSPSVLTVSALGRTGYRSIGAALAKAQAGAKIRVEPGIYTESLVLDKKVEIEPTKYDPPCVIEGVTGPALTMRAAAATVRGFTLRLRADSTAGFAVEIPQGRLLLDDCEISGGATASVAVLGTGTNPYLTRCRIQKSLRDGVLVVSQASPTFTDCTLAQNTQAGARVAGGAQPVFQGCVFVKNQAQGVILNQSGGAAFSKCDFAENGTAGVRAEADAIATFRSCNFRSNQGNGIIGVQKSELALEYCTFTRNQNGAEIQDETTVKFVGCRLSDHPGTGIAVRSNSRGTFEKCEIWGTGGHGIFVSLSSPTFKECNSIKNHGSALQVHNQSNPVFKDCELSHGVDWSAVVITGNSNPTLRRTKIHSSKHGGVEIVASRGAFENCEIYEHAWTGLSIGKSSDPLIRNCVIRNNGHWGVAVFDSGKGTLEGYEIRSNPRGSLDKHSNGHPVIRASRL